MIERIQKYRLLAAAAVVALALIGLSARLMFLHCGPCADRRVRINDLRRLEQNLDVGRGKILDRNGNILALDLVKQAVCAAPAVIQSNGQVQVVAASLADVLDLPAAEVLARLDNPASSFVFPAGFGRYADAEQAAAIARLKLPGVWLQDAMVRTCPRLTSACHILGFVNLERKAGAGVELRWDRYLRGVPGLRISEVDGKRRELYDRRALEIKPRRGADITLTADQYAQYIVESALEKAAHGCRAAAAWAIVERVGTGEILAMASWPAYDANSFRSASADEIRNRCIANIYEPGSTFKMATVSAALNEKIVTEGQVFDCENGTWFYRGKPLRDYHAYDRLSVADVVKKSSNIGVAKIALLLGEKKLYHYLRAFGIGQKTGIELPGEEDGILHPVGNWAPISITRIAIGQGVSVTALQMLGVLCAIANDGVLMKPYIVQRVTDVDGRVLFEQKPMVVGQPIRPETAAEMRRLLVRVTEEGGTGAKARVEGYASGGKTGTGQKSVNGGYSDTLNMASFAGFIPAADPQLGIIVVLDEPKGVRTGGAVAAPVFKEIAEQLVRYLDIPPDDSGAVASRAAAGKSRDL